MVVAVGDCNSSLSQSGSLPTTRSKLQHSDIDCDCVESHALNSRRTYMYSKIEDDK